MGFVNWFDTKGKLQIKQPFQAYYTKYTKTFADWLLGYESSSVDDSIRYGARSFGGHEDLIDALLAIGRAKGELMKMNDGETDIEKAMEAKIEELQKLEQRVYDAFDPSGHGSFEKFSDIWYGRDKEVEKDLDHFWLQKHLKFFTGQYQKIFYSKGLTQIEQILSLYAIEFEKVGIESNDQKMKSQIKTQLENEGLLEKIKFNEENKSGKKKRNRGTGYVPTSGTSEEEIYKRVAEIIEESFVAYFAENGKKFSQEKISEVLSNATNFNLKDRRTRFVIKKRGTDEMAPINQIESAFINLKLSAAKSKSRPKRLQDVTDQILKYLDTARRLTFNEQEWTSWQNYCDNFGGNKYIDKQFEALCKSFFSSRDLSNKNTEEGIMGILGELAAKGYAMFNLESNENAYVTSIASGLLYNKSKIELAADLIIQVQSKNSGSKTTFGIQVKNPFKTENGYYETYKKTWNLGEDDSINKFYDRIGLDAQGRQLFEMLNVNLNNTWRNYTEVLKDIIDFLRYYSLELSRLDTQEVKNTGIVEELKEETEWISVSNLFFVLKGELIPSSEIVKGLLKQYQILVGKTGDQLINAKMNNQLLINYKNKVKGNYRKVEPNRRSSGQFSGKQGGRKDKWGLKYNKDWIIKGDDYRNLLRDIQFTTSLKLQIPSLSQLGILKKR